MLDGWFRQPPLPPAVLATLYQKEEAADLGPPPANPAFGLDRRCQQLRRRLHNIGLENDLEFCQAKLPVTAHRPERIRLPPLPRLPLPLSQFDYADVLLEFRRQKRFEQLARVQNAVEKQLRALREAERQSSSQSTSNSPRLRASPLLSNSSGSSDNNVLTTGGSDITVPRYNDSLAKRPLDRRRRQSSERQKAESSSQRANELSSGLVLSTISQSTNLLLPLDLEIATEGFDRDDNFDRPTPANSNAAADQQARKKSFERDLPMMLDILDVTRSVPSGLQEDKLSQHGSKAHVLPKPGQHKFSLAEEEVQRIKALWSDPRAGQQARDKPAKDSAASSGSLKPQEAGEPKHHPSSRRLSRSQHLRDKTSGSSSTVHLGSYYDAVEED